MSGSHFRWSLQGLLLWYRLRDGACDLALSIIGLSGCQDTSTDGVPGFQATGGKRFPLCVTSLPPTAEGLAVWLVLQRFSYPHAVRHLDICALLR